MADGREKKPWEIDYSTQAKSDVSKPWEVDWENYKEPVPPDAKLGRLRKLADYWGEGAGSVIKGIGTLTNSDTLKEIGANTSEYYASDLAQDKSEMKSQKAVNDASGFINTSKALLSNPSQIFRGAVNSAPAMMLTAGAGGLTAKAAGGLAMRYGVGSKAAVEAAIAAGETDAVALEIIAAQAAKKAAIPISDAVGAATNAAGEGALQGANAYSDTYDYLVKKGATPEQAHELALPVGVKSGMSTAAIAGIFGNKLMEAKALRGGLGESTYKDIGKTFVKGFGEEVSQDVSTEKFSADAKRMIDPNYTSDYGKIIAQSGLTGGLMEGGFHLTGKLSSPNIGDQINEERQTQLNLHTNELSRATTVDEAITAAQKLNDVPIHVKTAEDFTSAITSLATDKKVEEIRNLSSANEVQDKLPEDQSSQVMDLMNALPSTSTTSTQAVDLTLSDSNVFSQPPTKIKDRIVEDTPVSTKSFVELRDQTKEIAASPVWQAHVASLPEAERIEANDIIAKISSPMIPARDRRVLAETVIEYAQSLQSVATIQPLQAVNAQNKLEPILPTIIPTEIKSNNPRDIIENSQFKEAIGSLSYVEPELLPKNGDGLTRQAAESIQKLGQALGKNVHFFNQNNAQVRLDGYAHPDYKNDIFVNIGRGDAGWHYVAGHEFFHQLPSDLKKSFIQSVEPLIPADKLGKIKEYINQGTLDEGGQWEEIGADLFGNRFGEADFLSKLLSGVKDTPTLLKMVKAIREFVTSVLASLKTQGFATDKFVTDLQKVRDSAQAILQEHLNQVKEAEKNVSEKVEQEATQEKTTQNAQAAIKILEQAGITGKERLDAIKDVKAGSVSIEELKSAYQPSVQFVREQKRIAAEKDRAFAEQERLATVPKEELEVIAEAGRDARVQEAENLTLLQGFDEDVPTAIEEKMRESVNNILLIPISKRTSLQKKLLKKFGIEEARKPRPKLIKRKSGVQGLRDSLKRKNSFLAFLAENGINTADRSDVGGQDNKRYFAAGYGALFRNKGLRLDELAQLAEEQGFLTQAEVMNESDNGGVNRLAEMINQAINGEVVTTGEQEFDFQSYYDDQLKNTALEFGIDIRGKSLDRLAELVNMYYASMDEATIDAREAEFELQLQDISNEVLEQLQQRSIDNLLDENETDNQRTDQDNVELASTVAPKADKQRALKEKNFNRREVERILDIPEENRNKKDADFLKRNQTKLSSERKELPKTIEVDGEQRSTKNSNGKPIADTEEKIRNFWKWFGDSKVVDEDGNPLVVYHGTLKDFNQFENNKRGAIFTTPSYDFSYDFITNDDKKIAEGGNVFPIYVSALNPFDFENQDHIKQLSIHAMLNANAIAQIKKGLWTRLEDRFILKTIKNLNFDGLYVKENDIKNLAVFNPNQIKSAIGNQGTFDATNPDIRMSSERNENALEEITKIGDAFKYPVSKKTELQDIINDYDLDIEIRKITNIPGETRYELTLPDETIARVMVRPFNKYGKSIYGFDMDADNQMTNQVDERPGKSPEDAHGKGDVWIDVSLLNEGGGMGTAIYQAVANYAHNNDMVFIGDPAGVSHAAMLRRPEQMLSSALKFGTTEHIAPHPKQIKGNPKNGIAPIDWVYGDHVGNIQRLIDANLQNIDNAGGIGGIEYDKQSGEFIDSGGSRITVEDLRGLAEAGLASKAQAGGRTLARYAFLKSVLSSEGHQEQDGWKSSELLVRLGKRLRNHVSTVDTESGGVKEVFYSVERNSIPLYKDNKSIPETIRQVAKEPNIALQSAKELLTAGKPQNEILESIVTNLFDSDNTLEQIARRTAKDGVKSKEAQQFLDTQKLYKAASQKVVSDAIKEYADPMLETLKSEWRNNYSKLSWYKENGYKQFLNDIGTIGNLVKHGRERNADIAAKTDGKDLAGSGRTDEEIAQIEKDIRKEAPGLIEIYEKIYKDNLKPMMDISNNAKRNSGLLTPEMEAARKDYKWYVPLYGDPSEFEQKNIGTGGGLKSPKDKKALGRSGTLADNVLENVLKQMSNSVAQAGKQEMKSDLIKWIKSSPAAKLAMDAKINDVTTKEIFEKYTAADGLVHERVKPSAAISPTAMVYRNGNETTVVDFSNPKVIDSLNGLKPIEGVLSGVQKTTRLMSAVFTRYNPIFPVMNKLRDSQSQISFVIADAPIKDKFKAAKDVLANNLKYTTQWGRRENKEYKEWKDKFEKLGGTTMYSDVLHDDVMKNIEREFSVAVDNKLIANKMANKLGKVVDAVNNHMEMSSRVAMFKALVDNGMTERQAALYTKNTMNFETKGKWGQQLGALYAFAGPALFDARRMAQSLRTPRGAMVMTAQFAMMYSLYGALKAMGGDDEDGVARLNKIPVNQSGRFLTFVGEDGTGYKIPVGFGYSRIALTLASALHRYQDGVDDIGEFSQHVAIDGLISNFSVIEPKDINIKKDAVGWAMQTFLPTVTQPLYQVASNKNFQGAPIHKPDEWTGSKLRFQQSWPNTSQLFKDAAKEIYDATGIDAYPETIAHLLRSYGGNGAMDLVRGFQLMGEKAEKDWTLSDIPALQGFASRASSQDANRFREKLAELNKLSDVRKYEIQQGNVAEFDAEHPTFFRDLSIYKAADKEIKALYKARKSANTETIKEVNKRIQAVQMRVNKEV